MSAVSIDIAISAIKSQRNNMRASYFTNSRNCSIGRMRCYKSLVPFHQNVKRPWDEIKSCQLQRYGVLLGQEEDSAAPPFEGTAGYARDVADRERLTAAPVRPPR